MSEVRIPPIDWGRGPEDYEAEYGIVDYRDKKVLDIGADVGSTADYFLRKGARVVIAVEGNEGFYKKLERNAKKIEGIIPIFLWIKTPKHFENLIKLSQPDVLKADCDLPGKDGCEKHLFKIDDWIFSMVSEYIVETHNDPIFYSMKEKCEKNGYELVNVRVRHRPDLRIVYAKGAL